MENPVISNILTRTSIRIFDPERPLPEGTAELLVRTAMAAPTACDKRPWQFIIVDAREILDRLAAVLPFCKMAAKAQAAIIGCADSSRFINKPEDDTLWIQDLSAASENILLAAHSLGIGAVWTALYPHSEREKAVTEILSLPEGIVPFNVIPLGYPTRDYKPRDKFDPARIHHNGW